MAKEDQFTSQTKTTLHYSSAVSNSTGWSGKDSDGDEEDDAAFEHMAFYRAAGEGTAAEQDSDHVTLHPCDKWDEVPLDLSGAESEPGQAWEWLGNVLETKGKDPGGVQSVSALSNHDMQHLRSLNSSQRAAVEIVVDHLLKVREERRPGFEGERTKQLKLIVTGMAGSGKSWVLKAISRLTAVQGGCGNMDQRIVQVSRTVEELMQASHDLLEASENEDAQATRHQPLQPSQATLEQLLLCHRHANGAVERLITDLQQADVMVRRLHTQGWHWAGMPKPVSTPPKGQFQAPPPGAGKWNPQEHMQALDAWEEEMQGCLLP